MTRGVRQRLDRIPMSPLVKALTDLGYTKKEAEAMTLEDAQTLPERLEAALRAYEKASGASTHKVLKRRLEAVFALLDIEEGALSADRFEGRINAQWASK